MKKKQKIFVGVSGGVDSSVVAHLLKKDGHEVHGVFVKTWSQEWLPCTWLAEKRDAMRVCAALDIPFHFLDAEQVYKDGVADYMIAEYKMGRTPNPDVLCNRVIKFGALWDYAKAHGADAVATGHYARVVSSNQVVDNRKTQNNDLSTTNYQLLTGSDFAKDQSYFLWMLTKDELAHVRFPIGHLDKNEVRRIAERADLFTAIKKDSQGICFLGDVDMREFLSHYIEMKQGDVVDERGEVIGTHDGVWFYTLGERHGFTIINTKTNTSPYYVIAKDIEHNQLVVSTQPKKAKTGKVTIVLRDTNWIEVIDHRHTYTAQIRYHGEFIPVKIAKSGEVSMKYDGLIALGQSLVIYDGNVLVGGGVIDSVK